MTDDHTQLQALVRELQEAKLEYDRLAFDEEEPHELGPPCTPMQLDILRAKLGKELPPSYQTFLELHNGWSNFDGDAKVLAVEDHAEEWVIERLAEIDELFFEDAENPFSKGCLPIVLGEYEDNYLILDPTTVRENGEMDFVAYDFGEEERRFKDFTSFLQHDLELTLELIRDEREGLDDEPDEDENENEE